MRSIKVASCIIGTVAFMGIAVAQTADNTKGKLGQADQDFADKAAVAGSAEVRDAQVAIRNAGSQNIKLAAQQMMQDHGAANTKLKQILADHGSLPKTDLDGAEKAEYDSLQKLTGDTFDNRYVTDQIAAHEKTIGLFKSEAASGTDPQLKQFAMDTLPTLQHHLEMITAFKAGK